MQHPEGTVRISSKSGLPVNDLQQFFYNGKWISDYLLPLDHPDRAEDLPF